MKFEILDNQKKFIEYQKYLKEKKIRQIAVDIEGESNLHQYGEKLCLIQIYDKYKSVLIDPFSVPMNLVKELLEDRNIIKIMFDALGDRAFLYKNNKIDILSILDLQVAVGLLDFPKRDLSSVLQQALGKEPSRSKKKFQMYNWTRRPIDKQALDYAVEDVLYLFDLKEKLFPDLIQRKLIEEFIHQNLMVQNKPHIYAKLPGLFRKGRYKALNKEEQVRFKTAFDIRDKAAQKLNVPPNSVFQNDNLFLLAKNELNCSSLRFNNRIPNSVAANIKQELTSQL